MGTKIACDWENCTDVATFRCPGCGATYCDQHASSLDFECDCVQPIELEQINGD